MNILTYRLEREPIPSDSETDSLDSDSELETNSEAERIAEQYPYTDSEDED